MNIVKVRSPFFIQIDEIGQDGSLIELFIWNKGTTEPTIPTYQLSKLIPSPTQVETSYNVSNFVKDFIDNIRPVPEVDATDEDNNEWVLFKVKRYTLSGAVYTLLTTTNYVGINGFTEYSDGVNDIVTPNPDVPAYALINPSIIQHRHATDIIYVNVIAQRELLEFGLTTRYFNSDNNALISTDLILPFGAGDEVWNYKIPLTSGTTKNQRLDIDYEETVARIYTQTIDECKYEPVVCSYINRYGGWQFLTFFKAQFNSINVTGSNFKLAPANVDYNIYKGQSKAFNINGTQTVKLNTGFVDENYSELITDLMLSETVLLDDKPVLVKSQSSELKSYLNEKLINYQIDFDYNYDLINNVQ